MNRQIRKVNHVNFIENNFKILFVNNLFVFSVVFLENDRKNEFNVSTVFPKTAEKDLNLFFPPFSKNSRCFSAFQQSEYHYDNASICR